MDMLHEIGSIFVRRCCMIGSIVHSFWKAHIFQSRFSKARDDRSAKNGERMDVEITASRRGLNSLFSQLF